MRIVVGADHGGVVLKDALVAHMQAAGHTVEDLGTHGTERAEYPDYAERVARVVAAHEADAGLLFCGTGIGMSIAANKVPGVRAAVVSDPFSARMSKEHNDANVLCLGGRVVGDELAKECVDAWLRAQFQGGRHAQRVARLGELDAQRGHAPEPHAVVTKPFIVPAVTKPPKG